MDQDTWLINIMSVVRELSDSAYQDKVWLRGEGKEVSSFNEMICGLFDDYNFEGFLDQYTDESELFKQLQWLRIDLNKYLEKVGEPILVDELLRDSNWRNIQKIAIGAVNLFVTYKTDKANSMRST